MVDDKDPWHNGIPPPDWPLYEKCLAEALGDVWSGMAQISVFRAGEGKLMEKRDAKAKELVVLTDWYSDAQDRQDKERLCGELAWKVASAATEMGGVVGITVVGVGVETSEVKSLHGGATGHSILRMGAICDLVPFSPVDRQRSAGKKRLVAKRRSPATTLQVE